MPAFALHPAQTPFSVAALLVLKVDQQQLFAKLRARAEHYEDMSLAVGDGWSVLFSDSDTGAPNLPWLKDGSIFLYQLSRGCLCEMGYQPNIPPPLIDRLMSELRKIYNIKGAMALLSGQPNVRLFDLSKARRLAQISLAALP